MSYHAYLVRRRARIESLRQMETCLRTKVLFLFHLSGPSLCSLLANFSSLMTGKQYIIGTHTRTPFVIRQKWSEGNVWLQCVCVSSSPSFQTLMPGLLLMLGSFFSCTVVVVLVGFAPLSRRKNRWIANPRETVSTTRAHRHTHTHTHFCQRTTRKTAKKK